MPDFLIDQVGVPVDANSLYGRLSREAQEAVDAKMREWFGQEHNEESER